MIRLQGCRRIVIGKLVDKLFKHYFEMIKIVIIFTLLEFVSTIFLNIPEIIDYLDSCRKCDDAYEINKTNSK